MAGVLRPARRWQRLQSLGWRLPPIVVGGAPLRVLRHERCRTLVVRRLWHSLTRRRRRRSVVLEALVVGLLQTFEGCGHNAVYWSLQTPGLMLYCAWSSARHSEPNHGNHSPGLVSCIPTASAGNVAFMYSHRISRKCCSCIPTTSAGNVAFMYSHCISRKYHLAILYGIQAHPNEVQDYFRCGLASSFSWGRLRPLKS
jgi:hypothetical protein